MTTLPRWVALFVAAAISLAGCNRGVRFTRTEQADFLEVRKEYTVVLLHPTFLRAVLGTDWDSQTLFFSPPGFSPACERIMGQRGPYRPLAKGEPVFTLGCTGWEAGSAFFYSVEKAHTVALHINLRDHMLQADAPTKPLSAPRFLADGGMVFN